MEIICTDASSPPQEVLQWFKHWVEQDNIYTLVRTIKTVDGQTGFILEELDNPSIPHPSGLGTFEPSYNSKRFTTLDGKPIDEERIKIVNTSDATIEVPNIDIKTI